MDVLVLVGPNDLKCATYCIKNIKQYVECRTIYVLCSQTTWNHLIHSMDDKDKSIQFIKKRNSKDKREFPSKAELEKIKNEIIRA